MRRIDAIVLTFAIPILALACFGLTGCHGLTVHIDGEAKPRVPKVDPPPAPPPPKDDWAPPWFRRPQPKNRGLSNSVLTAPVASEKAGAAPAANDLSSHPNESAAEITTTAIVRDSSFDVAVVSLPLDAPPHGLQDANRGTNGATLQSMAEQMLAEG